MSTASEGIPTDSAPRPGQPPSALAILTATALGGVVASRLPKAPLVLAAGATALAWLKQKKSIVHAPAPTGPRLAPPALEPSSFHAVPQDKIQHWLDQQIHRETGAPVVHLPPPEAPHQGIDDKYSPPAFLIGDEETIAPPLLADFASLTEPRWSGISFTAPDVALEVDQPGLKMPQSAESLATTDSGWLLGIDPLPSIGETPAPPVFTAPVFEGGALPDQIEVPQPPEPGPLVHLTPFVSEKAADIDSSALGDPQTPPEELEGATAVEIEVHVASPGDASFDPPLAAAPHNPWQLPEPPMSPAHTSPTPAPSTPVVEAEIVLRPRAPTQTSVIAKSRPLSPRFAPVSSVPSTTDDAAGPQASVPPAPQVTPREQRARPTWRSWWRGD